MGIDGEIDGEAAIREDIVELRIHGVGGETPYTTLGVDPADADGIRPRPGSETSGFYERVSREDRVQAPGTTVEAYNWAKLTSRSKLAPFWPLLLPFTLFNVAGFMHRSPRDGAREKTIRRLIKWAGYSVTATWSTWIAGLVLRSRGPLLFRTVAVIAFLVGLVVLARYSAKGFEAMKPPAMLLEQSGDGASLNDAGTWHWATWVRGQTWTHAAFGAVPVTLLLVYFWTPWSVGLNDLLVALTSVQGALLLVLAVFSVADAFTGERVRRGSGPWSAATVGIGMSHGYLSSTGQVLEWWNLSSLPPFGETLFVTAGYGAAATALAAVIVAAFVMLPGLVGRPTPPNGHVGPLQAVRGGVSLRRTALAQRTAMLLRHLGWVITPAAIAFYIVLLLELYGHFARSRGITASSVLLSASDWLGGAGALQDAARLAGSLTPWAVLMFLVLMIISIWNLKLRKLVAILWDVLTFWPRWHHPFAVRSYAERSVPELQTEVLERLSRGSKVIVCAHSQGAVLAYAALAPMKQDPDASCVALVTFGSPLTTLYSRFFPGWIDGEQQRGLHEHLPAWINCYRLTDFIGQRAEGLPRSDNVECPDPPLEDDVDTGGRWLDELPVRDRTSPLLRHSGYRSEPAMRDALTRAMERTAASRHL